MENSSFNNYIKEHLLHESSALPSPDRLLVFEARQTVMARGKKSAAGQYWAQGILAFLSTEVRMYHLGISMLLIFFSFFYFQSFNQSTHSNSSFAHYSEDAFALTNHTISVTSSTMLTSIPTMVIRN